MQVTSGSRLGPYEIVAPIGAGGMGEVYKARDTRLDRSVAIKILPSAFADNAQLKIRFEREAKTISQLTHPNICTLYDVGNEGGVEYLVMELLDGDTLADRIARGPLPMRDVLRYGREIAVALDRAHRAGVVHRDLKPGNVMITKSGAKLLDFGLATEGAAVPASVSDLTQQKPLTKEGTIIGTFQYMAPEQLEGRDADARSDIFALGAVLYEMATGRRAFEAKSHASLIASILAADPPPVSSVQPASPVALDRVIRTCLEKDPDARWQSAHDVALELRDAGEIEAPAAGNRRGAALSWSVAALLAIALAVVAVRERLTPATQPQVIRFEIQAPDPKLRASWATCSPSGRLVAFCASAPGVASNLWLRPMDGAAARKIADTEGAIYPFWSPDSRFVAFFTSGKLRKMSVEGGPPQTICDTGSGLPRGGTWSNDGLIVYALAGGPLLRVDSRGGKPVPALPLDASRSERGQRHPWFLPDGKHLLYLSRCDDPDQDGIYVASLDGGRPRRLSNALSNAFYSPPGFLLFGENDSVRGQRFDVNKLELVGSPFTIAANAAIATSLHFVHAGISDNGVVVYCVGAASPPELAWVDREGLRSAPIAEGLFPAIAADGKRVACEQWSKDSSADQIWILDPDRGATRLTNARQWSQNPIWSRDGRFVAYRRGTVLLRRLADGTAAEQVIGQIPLETNLSDWTSDGRYIVGHSFEGATKSDILIFPAAGGAPVKIAASPFSETWGKVSPDGHWLAFQSDDTGRYEVYVQQFDPSGAPRQKLQVSRSGGNLPHWSPDGKSLVWADSAGTFFTSTITFGPELRTSPPKPLFDTQYPGMFFDLGPDGRILVTAAPFHPGNSIGVVVNWPGLVKEND